MKAAHKKIFLFVIKLVIGITFVYSSFHKIEDPAEFARIIYGYAVFPETAINFLAITIPFVELMCGFCLIFNMLPSSALLIINTMLIVFIGLIGFNLLRGHEFDCGCFSSAIGLNPKLSNIYSLIRDIILLWAGFYYWKNIKAFLQS